MGLTGLLLIVASAAVGGYGASATPDEMKDMQEWSASVASMISANYDGRPLTESLPGWTVKTEDGSAENGPASQTTTYTDPATGLEIACKSVQYADYPAVEWLVTLRNTGDKDTPILEGIRPLDWRVPWSEDGVTVHYSLGDSNNDKSFAPMTQALSPDKPEPFVLAPKGGRSSEDYMPFFNIQGKGRGAVMAVGWSGQWETTYDYTGGRQLRVASGIQTTHLTLHPGEAIRMPRMLLVFWRGDDPLRGNNLFRQLLISHYLPRRNGELVLAPICGSVGEADPDGNYEGPHVRVMAPYAKRGIEVFWSDMDPQQWYPVGFPEGTGTWEPDPVKYPNGLKPVGDAAHAAGLQYLLWFEPERVAKNTRISNERSDWVIGGKDGGLFRLYLPEARKWITDYVDVQVTAGQLDWMRWDFNIQPLKYWRETDTPDRQGMTEIRYIEGLYAMWDDLRARHPGMVIDLCASGGRRNDLESLMRGLPLWHSDMHCFGPPDPAADQLQNSGLNRWIPLHGNASFELEPSYAFRSSMTTGNILVPLNPKEMLKNPEPAADDPVVRTVALYKKVRPYMLGDFYPLTAHDSASTAWFAYQMHRADLNAGMIMVFRRKDCEEETTTIKVRGLEPDRKYEVTCEELPFTATLTGKELAECPVTLPLKPSTTIMYYKAVSGN